jgi:tetratricopeptide (TPR) repeat protein
LAPGPVKTAEQPSAVAARERRHCVLDAIDEVRWRQHPIAIIMVASPTPSSRYRGFSATLAHARRGSRSWWRARAGLLLFDLIERRISRGHRTAAPVHRSVAARRGARQVTPQAVRRIMHAVIRLVVEGAPAEDVLVALADYGKQLNRGGHFGLGSDVYRFIIQQARTAGALARLPQWYEDLGYSLREAGRPDGASVAYHRGLELADENGDVFARFRLQIAQAHVDRVAERYDEARALLRSALESAEAFGRLDLVVRAGHESGVLAHDCGRLEEALAFYSRALHASGYGDGDHRHGRERLILDIGRALIDMGYLIEARGALAVLATTAAERFTRWTAMLNLLYLATEEDDQWRFEEYSQALARAPMPAHLRLFYYAQVAEGCTRFGLSEAARASHARAVRLAERVRLQVPDVRSSGPRKSRVIVDPAALDDLVSAILEFTGAPRSRVDARHRSRYIEPSRPRRRLFLQRGRTPTL